MKDIVIYIHSLRNAVANTDENWVASFSEYLQRSFSGNYNRGIKIVFNSDEFFNTLIYNKHIGVYLPLIDSAFANDYASIAHYREIKNRINKQFGGKALFLSLLTELFPDNHVQFQPFFKFYLQEGQKLKFKNLDNDENIELGNYFEFLLKKLKIVISRVSSNNQTEQAVYISATTSDLSNTSDQLYNFLLNNDISVQEPIDYLEKDYFVLKQNIKQNLQKSWLSIHPCSTGILGTITHLTYTQSFFELEFNIAAQIAERQIFLDDDEYRLRRILWIPHKPSVSTYEGRLIERILNSPNLIAGVEVLNCSFEELKQIIISYASKEFSDYPLAENIQLQENEQKDSFNIEENSIFILYDKAYRSYSESLKQHLLDKSIVTYSLDDFENDKSQLNTIQETLLDTCKGVIILTSNWNTDWYKFSLNEVIKSKVRRKEDIGFVCTLSKEIESLPAVFEQSSRLIRISDSFDPNNLLPLNNLLN